MKLLIEASANLNVGTCGVVPIVVAATQVEPEMIKCLLKEGADPNHEGLTPLEIAPLTLFKAHNSKPKLEIRHLRRTTASTMASFCGNMMAMEYFAIGDFVNAKQLFDGVASLYSQEGWVALLWEMAVLPISSSFGSQPSEGKYGPAGPASLSQRQIIHDEVFKILRGEVTLSSNEDSGNLKVEVDKPLCLEIDPISPLRVVLLASVAFHEQVVKPGASTLLTISLLSQLPQPVEIDQLEIQFNQPECNFLINSAQQPTVDATSCDQQDLRIENAPFLKLLTNKWLRLIYDIKSEQSGKLDCISVISKVGPCFTIICRAESPGSMDELPLWKFEERVDTLPTKDPGLAFSGQKVIQVEEQDSQVDLALGATGPALVGESFLVPVTVTSKGHSIHFGELKINLVNARGGGLASPRESEPFSNDSHNVQLLNILGPDGEYESQKGSDNIRSIQHSFGLISVPLLNIGESWSCNLEIKWHKPKPVMLYVSLDYLPTGEEAKEQKVHVHKSLQIEGKTAVTISHHYMCPFRRDPLLLTKIKRLPGSDQLTSLALNEISILVVSAKNCSEVPLRVILEHWSNIKALESEEVTEKRKVKAKEKFNEAKSQGETAFRKKEYLLATKWYSMDTNLDPSDANVYSNKSLCYALLKGEVALADANTCINLKHESLMASTPSIDEEERNRGSMWMLDQKLDQPMDEEAGRLRNMYMEKTFSSLLVLRLAFQSLGIVYGDLGTSPLYVFYNTFPGGIDDLEDVIGALSMIIYSLTLIPLLEYVFVVLRANDNDQGGTFALYSLLCRHAKIKTIPNQHRTDEKLTTYSRHTFHEKSFATKTKKWLEAQAYRKTALLILVLVGTCMVIGDGILTPAISCLTKQLL
ncbi:hypothetical protein IFM89_005047 [Coptis chinensis]|uniref:Uncharacterized protein n=1 Tax=Coptis chinensis TaxID=261450 RepID=A0A835HNP4_9MAGN|nr:hypothetical protein IFM89_005047 [Coptis chinensis]